MATDYQEAAMRRTVAQFNTNVSKFLAAAASGDPLVITRGRAETDYVAITSIATYRRHQACERIVGELMQLAARDADCVEYQSIANAVSALAEVPGVGLDLPGMEDSPGERQEAATP